MKNILNLTISQLNKHYLRKWSQDLTITQDLQSNFYKERKKLAWLKITQ
jgi:hypothetical protein